MFKTGDMVEYVHCPEYSICPELAKSLEEDQGVVVEWHLTSILVNWKKNKHRRMYPKELTHASVKDRIIHRVMSIEYV